MALFERDRVPSRSALSRDFSALTEEPVEALRTLFLDERLRRPLTTDKQTGGLMDPRREQLGGHRPRWHAGSRPPTGVASDRRSAPGLRVGWTRSVRLGIEAASVDKW
jgi:hypothetical protein